MSLHTIIEPAGTLLTGWALVPENRERIDGPDGPALTPAERAKIESDFLKLLPEDPQPAKAPSHWDVPEIG